MLVLKNFGCTRPSTSLCDQVGRHSVAVRGPQGTAVPTKMGLSIRPSSALQKDLHVLKVKGDRVGPEKLVADHTR